MSFFLKKEDYLRENLKTRPLGVKTDKSLKKTTAKDLEHCPRRCTQRRTLNNHLAEKKTFDPKTGICRNCGFSRRGSQSQHKLVFTKASLVKT